MILALLMMLNINPTIIYANECENNENYILAEEAKYLALALVWETRGNDDTQFNDDLYYSHTFTMYDADLNVSAYIINFADVEGEPNGYVMVSAVSEYPEIIEFSDTGISPYEEAYLNNKTRSATSEFPIYIGNMLPLTNEEISNLSKAENTRAIKAYEKEKSSYVQDIYEASGGASSIGQGDFLITNPGAYESGTSSSSHNCVPGYNVSYVKMSDYGNYSNHCGPIAATNMMIYWRSRNLSKYSGFYLNSWNGTFVNLYNRMYFAGTTYVGNFTSGATNFTKAYSDKGITFKYYSPSNTTVSKMISEINADRPFALLLQDHGYYGDHYVVGVGYYKFTYSNNTSSTYIQVTDGWSSSASRYVYYNSNRDYYLITAIPN